MNKQEKGEDFVFTFFLLCNLPFLTVSTVGIAYYLLFVPADVYAASCKCNK